MKKSLIISLQVLILVALGVVGYNIYTAEQEVKDVKTSLFTTITLMDELYAEKQEAAALEQKQQEEFERMQQPLNTGDQAPPFALKNLDDEDVTLDMYQGKELLLVFAQPDCEFCHNFYPELNKFIEQRSDVETLVVQMDASPEISELQRDKFNIQTKVFPANSDIILDYKVQSTPTTILINKAGEIAGKGVGNSFEDLMNLTNSSD